MLRRLTRAAGVLAAAAVVLSCGGADARAPQGGTPAMRVLFVGNSYTYFNNLPCLVSEIAKSRGRTIDAEMLVEGGASLGTLWQKPEIRAAIDRPWDAVVLQTQSTFGVAYYVEGLERIADTSSLLRDSRPFVERARARGTRVFLFEQWKRLAAPERDQLAIHEAFGTAAQALGATVIPAGFAWELAGRQIAPKELYDTDGSHPSPTGSYLVALAAYATLTGDTVQGTPSTVTCPAVDHDTGAVTTSAQTNTIAPQLAGPLQQAATTARREWSSVAGRPAPAIERPQLPAVSGNGFGNLQGNWTGTIGLYPRYLPWPARMELNVLTSTTARLTISFGGKPDDIVRDVSLATTAGALRFEDPQGPNRTVVKYQGVRQGDVLSGIAEFTGNAALYGIGRWSVSRPRTQ